MTPPSSGVGLNLGKVWPLQLLNEAALSIWIGNPGLRFVKGMEPSSSWTKNGQPLVCSRDGKIFFSRPEAFCRVDVENSSFDCCSSSTPLLSPSLDEFIFILDPKAYSFHPPQSRQSLSHLVQDPLFRCVHTLGIFRTKQCVRTAGTARSVLIQHIPLYLANGASSRWRLRCVVDAFRNSHADTMRWLAQEVPDE